MLRFVHYSFSKDAAASNDETSAAASTARRLGSIGTALGVDTDTPEGDTAGPNAYSACNSRS